MADKRAETNALKRAFSIPLPSAEEIGTPDDPNIIEGKATILPQEDNPVVVSKRTQDAPDHLPGDTDIPETFVELCQWALTHGKDKNGTWIARQLGFTAAADIKDIKNAYFQLKEITGWEAYKKGA